MNKSINLKRALVPLLAGLALVVITAIFSAPARAMAIEESVTSTNAPVVLAWYYGPGHRYYGGYRRGWGPGWRYGRGWGAACKRVCWYGPYGGLHCGTRCY